MQVQTIAPQQFLPGVGDSVLTSKAKVRQFFINLILRLVQKEYTVIERRFGRPLNALKREEVKEFIEGVIQRDIEDLWTRYKTSAFVVIADMFEISVDTARQLFVQTSVQANGRGGRWHVVPHRLDALRGGDAEDERTAEQNAFRQTYQELCLMVDRVLNTSVDESTANGVMMEYANVSQSPASIDAIDLDDFKELGDLSYSEAVMDAVLWNSMIPYEMSCDNSQEDLRRFMDSLLY